jgi:SdpC family antimicrobial peptide
MFDKKLFVAVAMASLITTLVACTTSAPKLQPVLHDGHTLFEGIFFGVGMAGQQLPEIWHGKSASQRADSAEAARAIDIQRLNIVRNLERDNPTFFPDFALAIRSGDHLRIENALEDAAQKLNQSSGNGVHTQLELDPELGTRVAIAETDTAFMIRETALAVFEVRVNYLYRKEESNSMLQSNANATPLQRDVFVDIVARRFAEH